jgi:hypothetical protein
MPRDGRGHIVLLGDSIFDNRRYTAGEPDVATHLRTRVGTRWKVTLRAVDGSTTRDLEPQLLRLPDDATHLVVSVGGNDALQSIDLLSLRVTTITQALERFAQRLDAFERSYRGAIQECLRPGHPVAVCTIYHGALEEDLRTAARVGVSLFNDVILRTAIDLQLSALELRSICTEPGDYANPIEPSGVGGGKIATAIANMILESARGHARIWSA